MSETESEKTLSWYLAREEVEVVVRCKTCGRIWVPHLITTVKEHGSMTVAQL